MSRIKIPIKDIDKYPDKSKMYMTIYLKQGGTQTFNFIYDKEHKFLKDSDGEGLTVNELEYNELIGYEFFMEVEEPEIQKTEEEIIEEQLDEEFRDLF